MPVFITCQHCGRTKSMPPSVFKRTPAKYCSKACEGAARTLKVSVACAHCGSVFTRRRDKIKDRTFCSHKCAMENRAARASLWGRKPDVEARRSYFRNYEQTNRERINEQHAAWARRNRPKRNRLQQMRRAGGMISAEQWAEVLRINGGACLGCGTTDRVEVDHIIPIARGGKTEVGNLQPLCRACNASKGAKLMAALHGEVIEV